LPDIESGRVSRLAHGLFDPQRILQKQGEQALVIARQYREGWRHEHVGAQAVLYFNG